MYYNQNDYAKIPYPYPGETVYTTRRNLQTSGCGPVAMAMVLSELGLETDPVDMAQLALSCGARYDTGTHMPTLVQGVLARFEGRVTCTTTGDAETVRGALLRGCKAIAYIGGNAGSYVGLFSTTGHYVAVVAVDGTDAIVWDPDYRKGKYDSAGRAGRAQCTWPNPDVRVPLATLHRDTQGKSPRYFIFEAIGRESEDEDMVRYAKMEDIPAWGRETVDKLMALGLLRGRDDQGTLDISEDMLRGLVINDRAGCYDKEAD